MTRTAAAECGLFTHKSVSLIFEPPCNMNRQEVGCRHKALNFVASILIVILRTKYKLSTFAIH
jgi:hypothetical protein